MAAGHTVPFIIPMTVWEQDGIFGENFRSARHWAFHTFLLDEYAEGIFHEGVQFLLPIQFPTREVKIIPAGPRAKPDLVGKFIAQNNKQVCR